MRAQGLLVTTLALLAALGVAAPAVASRLPALAPAPDDALTQALARGELTEAQYALERAASVFHRPSARFRGRTAQADPHAATPILRDLAVRAGQLDPAGRARAEALLARPTDGADDLLGDGYTVEPAPPACNERVCVHWVATGPDAPPGADTDGNGRPDHVDTTLRTMDEVWQREVVELGYRPPKDDSASPNHGPDGRIDVYLKDIGPVYGYCTTDDPGAALTPSGPWDVSAYCVLDNDYALLQFPTSATSLAALQVTVAHEFFHAVQFGYDFLEDLWMLEGTAVWMEDEVYDDVNDNYQYLDRSPFSHPNVPLDLAVRDSSELSGFVYGSFVFFRFLSERMGGPDLIRRAWEFADGSPGAPDQFSLQAIDSALRERGSSARAAFATFGAVNAMPMRFYEEGTSYPTPPVGALRTLSPRRQTATGRAKLDHLTTWYGLFRPGARVPKGSKLRITLDLPARSRGSEAAVVVARHTGLPKILPVKLNAKGDGARTVTAFDARSIKSVRLILSNASSRSVCGQGLPFSCLGLPLDDAQAYRYTARLLPPS